eukprot:g6748.t1
MVQENVQNEQKQLAKELSEARAANCSQSNLGELARMMPRLRQSLVKVEAELAKVKNNLAKVRADAVLAKQRVEAVEAAAEAEQRDARAFQAALPEAMEIVTQAEDAVETVAILAAAMSVDDETDTSEAHQARKLVSNRLGETKRFAPEAKRVAMQEFQAMEKRLAEAAKRLNPLKRFRQEFEQKAAAKKALQEIQNKLNSAELEIEKAHIMTSSTDTQMEQASETRREIPFDRSSLANDGAGKWLSEVVELFEADIRTYESIMVNWRSKEEIEANSTGTIPLRPGPPLPPFDVHEADGVALSTIEVLRRDTFEEWNVPKPLLRSLLRYVLPRDSQVADFCAGAGAAAIFLNDTGLVKAYAFDPSTNIKLLSKNVVEQLRLHAEEIRLWTSFDVTMCLTDFGTSPKAWAQSLPEDDITSTTQLLGPAEEDLKKTSQLIDQRQPGQSDAASQKELEGMKKRVVEAREKLQSIRQVLKRQEETLQVDSTLSQVHEKIEQAEEAFLATSEAEMPFLKGLEVLPLDEGAQAVVKVLNTENLDSVTVESLKTAFEQSVAAEKEAVRSYNQARQIITAKQKEVKEPPVLTELTRLQKKLAAAHQEMIKSRQLAKGGDQLIKGKKIFNEEEKKVVAMEQAVERIKAAVTAVNTSTRTLEAAMTGASVALKTSLTSLMTKVKDASSRVEKAKQASKTQREKAAAEVFVKEAEQQAELPFLKGIEVLPLSEASIAIAECEKAAKHVQEALEKAKSFVSAKVMEVQRFAEAAAKPCLERLNGLVERNNAAATKLTEFRKDTESHKRTSQMQEAEEMLNAAEAEIEKTREAGAPLSAEESSLQDLSSITQEIGTEICEKIAALEKGASKKVSDALNFLAERRKDCSEKTQKELEQFQARLGKIKASLAEAKKTASQQEQRFVSRKLQAEGLELVNEVERENNFKGSSKDSVFQQACGERERVTLEGFQAFVTWILEQSGEDSRDVFLEQEVEAMFTHLDSDKSGDLTEKKFQDIFLDQFACVQPVSMTESFSISEGKSVLKLDLGVAVEALSRPQYDEQQKLTRLHCRLLEDSTKEGWVTMKGNQGKVFLDRLSPHSAHQKMMSASTKVVNKASSFLSARRKELNDCSNGPLLEAKVKMEEFKVKASSLQRKLDEIKKKVAEAAKEYEKCEAQQKRARSDARDKRLLDAMTKAIEQELHTLKAEEKRIAEVVAPLTNGADLEVLDAPVSILKDGKEMAEKLKEQSAAARCLNNLPDLKLTTEQISLMLDRIIGDNSEDGVISRWNFLRRFQQFYECQKTIALTHDLAITNSKPIRMLNAEEAIEV